MHLFLAPWEHIKSHQIRFLLNKCAPRLLIPTNDKLWLIYWVCDTQVHHKRNSKMVPKECNHFPPAQFCRHSSGKHPFKTLPLQQRFHTKYCHDPSSAALRFVAPWIWICSIYGICHITLGMWDPFHIPATITPGFLRLWHPVAQDIISGSFASEIRIGFRLIESAHHCLEKEAGIW